MRPFSFVLSLLALSVGSAHAQSTTVVDALGQTVVEFITIDQALGLPTTQTLQTLTTTAAATTAVATTATTAADGQQGPVGVPAATSDDAGPTVYTYTTTDAGGDTVAVVDTFTPTFVTTSTWVSAPAGTVLAFSSWQGLVGTNTVAPEVSAASPRWTLQHKWFGIASSVCAAVAGGAWLVLA
ncbi:uncharacterized protein TRAVEDRAFT_72802 [Trametes versicolor FP-101664 SS1]|uniref:uncharacterized protein n=1 Tax=Trametes versicolor (strain FP-101664) TaxID=717944 RepID=UPI00046218B6|nr:uncharacterized protein TRAVEDRAFT_72802 [Trametes versicolor FP-101664 SS1]EIW57845.1 hypothetical protein TRAVEDRAFT_72802 [Trametes versicolor FP-101664 SS1]